MAQQRHFIQARALGKVRLYEHVMERLETSAQISLDHRTSKLPPGEYTQYLGSDAPWFTIGPSARDILPRCSVSVAAVWTTVAVWLVGGGLGSACGEV